MKRPIFLSLLVLLFVVTLQTQALALDTYQQGGTITQNQIVWWLLTPDGEVQGRVGTGNRSPWPGLHDLGQFSWSAELERNRIIHTRRVCDARYGNEDVQLMIEVQLELSYEVEEMDAQEVLGPLCDEAWQEAVLDQFVEEGYLLLKTEERCFQRNGQAVIVKTPVDGERPLYEVPSVSDFEDVKVHPVTAVPEDEVILDDVSDSYVVAMFFQRAHSITYYSKAVGSLPHELGHFLGQWWSDQQQKDMDGDELRAIFNEESRIRNGLMGTHERSMPEEWFAGAVNLLWQGHGDRLQQCYPKTHKYVSQAVKDLMEHREVVEPQHDEMSALSFSNRLPRWSLKGLSDSINELLSRRLTSVKG